MVPAPKRNLLNVSVYDAGNAVPHQSLAEVKPSLIHLNRRQVDTCLWCAFVTFSPDLSSTRTAILHDGVCTKPFVEPDPAKLDGDGNLPCLAQTPGLRIPRKNRLVHCVQ